MRRPMTVAFLGALLLLGTLATTPRAHAQLPPHSKAYGHSLGEWMKIYWKWNFFGGPDTICHVRLMPLPNLGYVSGSGTPEDPVVLSGHLDVTLKHGAPFVLPMLFFFGETYLPGTPVAFNPDPPLPLAAYDATELRVILDGKTIIDSAQEGKLKYYVGAQYYDTPLSYATPTSYGSTALVFVQGFGFVHQPLSKGVHTLSVESLGILPAGVYANAPDGFGNHFFNSFTITVK